VFGGYRFNPNLAVELALVNLGKASYSGTFLGVPVTGGQVKVSGLNGSAVALHPVNPNFELFAKAGLFAWNADASDTTGGVPFSAKDDGVNLSLGIGANYYFTKNVGARLEWEHFDLDPDKASMLSAGIVVKF
jgi:OOP family OmpA-OmpF porin